jgi:hypothetical protein
MHINFFSFSFNSWNSLFLEAAGHAVGQGIPLFYKLHIVMLCPHEPFAGLGRLQPPQPPFLDLNISLVLIFRKRI